MQDYLDIALRLLRRPTAPFHEHHVVAEIDRLVTAWDHGTDPDLGRASDPFGNLLLTYDGCGEGPWLYLTGHLDHPALGYVEHLTSRDVLFERLGGLPVQFSRHATVCIHSSSGSHPLVRGRIIAYLEEGLFDGEPRPAFRVRLPEPLDQIGPGSFAVWDLPAPHAQEGQLRAGACDDLAGVAVALMVVQRLLQDAVPTRLALLLTRAEETGFGGMLAAAGEGLLDPGGVYVNIECSSHLAGAPLGAGPVIRVGDKRWLFDPLVTAALVAAAEGPDGGDAVPFQRRLMDGGTCEATVLSRAGVPTGAVALPLANYHNTGRRRIRNEAIDLSDAGHLVELLLRLTSAGAGAILAGSTDRLTAELDTRHRRQTPRLRQTAPLLPSPDPADE